MRINISIPQTPDLKPRIVVIGVGGAGGNAVNNMIDSGLDGVEFIVANTDAQALALSKAEKRVQMGGAVTQGLGAGMRPELGEEAAEDSLNEIMEHLEGAHMLFIAAGMGGGTGTGAAPVIARAARDLGILTVAIVTKPFQFEGSKRMKLAEAGLEKLYNCVDTLIVIPNQNLFRVATESTTMADAFAMADEVLNSGVRGVTDLMVVPGLINLDFNDVRTVMNEMGKAMMGTGEATGERRALEAAESAIANPLLDDVSLKGAKGVLVNITGGEDLTLFEVEEAASLIRGQVDPEANIIIGSTLNEDLDGIVRISVVATGVESGQKFAPIATPRASEEAIAEIPSVEEAGEIELDEVANVEDEKATPELDDDTISRPSEPAPFTYQRPGAETPDEQAAASADILEPMTPHEAPSVVKPIFGFFGRKKTKPVMPIAKPAPDLNHTGDLFGADTEDELEIPSFLRRGK
jgi:cell division protein FtsZ